VKHLLEYDEVDVRGLLGDLEGVGQAEKRSFSVWIFVPEYRDDYENRRSVFLPAAEGTIWSGGDLEKNKGTIYEKLKSGDFRTGEIPYSEIAKGEKPLLDFLTGPSLREFFADPSVRPAGFSKGLKGLLVDLKIGATRIQNGIYPGEGDVGANHIGVVLFYGEEGEIKKLTESRMREIGLSRWFLDSHLPGTVTGDLTRGGRTPGIEPA